MFSPYQIRYSNKQNLLISIALVINCCLCNDFCLNFCLSYINQIVVLLSFYCICCKDPNSDTNHKNDMDSENPTGNKCPSSGTWIKKNPKYVVVVSICCLVAIVITAAIVVPFVGKYDSHLIFSRVATHLCNLVNWHGI